MVVHVAEIERPIGPARDAVDIVELRPIGGAAIAGKAFDAGSDDGRHGLGARRIAKDEEEQHPEKPTHHKES